MKKTLFASAHNNTSDGRRGSWEEIKETQANAASLFRNSKESLKEKLFKNKPMQNETKKKAQK